LKSLSADFGDNNAAIARNCKHVWQFELTQRVALAAQPEIRFTI
jgi:hypothetical protein